MIPDQRLIERDMGSLEGQPRKEYNTYLYWDYEKNIADDGVEPIQDVFKRCKSFLEDIKEKYPNENILVVTHGAPYRALRYLLTNHKLKGKLYDGLIKNCQYEEFKIEK